MPLPPAYPKPARFSTTEQPTGRLWIDGKPIYRKVIDLGQLPNATSKAVAHGISNLGDVVDLRGIAKDSMSPNSFPLPFVKIAATEQQVQLSQDGDDITVAAGTDRSGFTGLALIEYTKD